MPVATPSVTRNLRDGSITLRDGSATPKTLTMKITSGDLAFEEDTPTFIVMNRGKIDSRKQGDEVPTPVSWTCLFEQWSYDSGSSTGISPRDALRGIGNASNWVSTDACGPYSVDVVFVVQDPCNPGHYEQLVFSKFTPDKISFKEGNETNTLSISGKALIPAPARTYV